MQSYRTYLVSFSGYYSSCVIINNSQKAFVAATLQGTCLDSVSNVNVESGDAAETVESDQTGESTKLEKENGWKTTMICCLRAAVQQF